MARIDVKVKQTGQLGTVEDYEFDPAIYDLAEGAQIASNLVESPNITSPTGGEMTTTPRKSVNPLGLSLENLYQAKAKAQAAGDKSYVTYYQNLIDTEESFGGTIPERAKIEQEEGVKPATVRVVNQLENLFFGEAGQESLSFAKAGLGGRLPGVAKSIERTISPGEPGSATERLNNYIRTLESVRPQLAKAAGDSGNIAFAEQLQAGKGLPQPTDTPSEAINLMQSAREKFGLPRSEKLEILRKEIMAKEAPERMTAEKATKLANRGFLENLVSTEATREYVGKWPEIILDSVVGTGKNVLDLVKGDIESIKTRNEEFKPELQMIKDLDKAARAEISTKIETITGISALKGFLGKRLSGQISGTSPEKVKAVLQEGMNLVKNGQSIRNTGIETAESVGKKIDGTKVFNLVKQLTDDASSLATKSQKREIANFVKVANQKINGKLINPKTAKKLWDVADDGFSAAGKAGKTIEATYHRSVRDAIRKELDTVTGGAFEKGTAMIREGLSKNRILKSLGSSIERGVAKQTIEGGPIRSFLKKEGGRLAGAAATGLTLAAVSKALGLQFPGAAYTPEQ